MTAPDARHPDAGAPTPDAGAPAPDGAPAACGLTRATIPFARHMVATRDHVYVLGASGATIQVVRVNKSTRAVEPVGSITPDQEVILRGMVVDEDQVYLALEDLSDDHPGPGGIYRLPATPASPARLTTESPQSLAVDGTHLYWSTIYPERKALDPAVRRMPKAGGMIETVAHQLELFPLVAALGSDIYFTDGLSLMRKPKSGGSAAFVTDLSEGGNPPYANQLIVSGDRLFWFSDDQFTIHRLPGPSAGTTALYTDVTIEADTVYVDGDTVYWRQWDDNDIHRLAAGATTPQTVFNDTLGSFVAEGSTLYVGESTLRALPLGQCTR